MENQDAFFKSELVISELVHILCGNSIPIYGEKVKIIIMIFLWVISEVAEAIVLNSIEFFLN